MNNVCVIEFRRRDATRVICCRPILGLKSAATIIRPARDHVAPRSGDLMVAVGFSPRLTQSDRPRRVATVEPNRVNHSKWWTCVEPIQT
jgi:hypothetical protein